MKRNVNLKRMFSLLLIVVLCFSSLGMTMAEGSTPEPMAMAGVIQPMSYTNGVFTITNPNGSLQSMIQTDLDAAPFSQNSNYDYAVVEKLTITGTMADADYAFIRNNLSELTTLDISGISNTSLPNNALDNGSSYANGKLDNLTTVALPSLLINIGRYAFNSCSGIAGQMTIPQSVASIDYAAFSGCTGITSLSLPTTGSLTIGSHAFQGTGISDTLTIPQSVTGIGDSAFRDLTGITSLDLSTATNLASIGNTAFNGCTGITGQLTIPQSVTSIGQSAFDGCSKIISLDLSTTGSMTIGTSAFQGTGISGTLTIPQSVTGIGDSAFRDLTDITSLDLSTATNLASIGQSAFNGCTGISGTLTIPQSVTSIGQAAFYGCTDITSLSLPATGSLTIGSDAFQGTGISGTLTIPQSVTGIGQSAFNGLTGITELDLSTATNLASIDGTAFNGCTGITGTLTIPQSVTSIGDSAFSGTNIDAIVFTSNAAPLLSSYGICDSGVRSYYPSGWGSVPVGMPQPAYAYSDSAMSVTGPGDKTIQAGAQDTLSVAVSGGTSPYTYFWRVYDSLTNANADATGTGVNGITLLDGGAYLGTNTETLTITADVSLDGKYYRCFVTDGHATAPHTMGSQAAMLTVAVITPVTGVTLDKPTLALAVGGSGTLIATVEPPNATNRAVTWSSDNTSVATVTNGVVTAVAPGTTTITVKTVDGNHNATCVVTVADDTPPQDVVYHFTSNFGTYTGQAEGLTGVIDASVSAFTELKVNGQTLHGSNYSINAGSTIITLHPSYLDTLANGTHAVRAVFTDGYAEGSFTVNIQDDTVSVTGVTLDKTKLTLAVDKNTTLTATVSPSNATNKGVKWSSSDTSVATVDNSGKVTAKKAGTAAITVTTDDGGYTAACKVNVTSTDTPSTGDNGNLWLWLALIAASVVGVCVLIWRKRRNEKR